MGIVDPPQNVHSFAGAVANQIVNAGFETGDTTGWTNLAINGQIIAVNPHSGTYCAQIYPSGGREGDQTLPSAIAVSVITALTVWYRQGILNQSYMVITYDDATQTNVGTTDTSGNWAQLDALSSLTTGKKVSNVKLLGGSVGQSYWDDVVLNAPSTVQRSTTLLTYPPQS
jgi:hypothetical protein